MLSVQLLVVLGWVGGLAALPYHYSKKNQKRSVKMSPSLAYAGKLINQYKMPLARSEREAVIDRYNKEGQELVHEGSPRMDIGLDTGNPAADHEATMWLMALIGTLAAAIPVAFLSPSLGFKKRSADDTETTRMQELVVNAIQKARKVYAVKDL